MRNTYTVKGYQDLLVWQKSMDLAESVYRLVQLLPNEEIYALSGQMRRAAISIPSNIAEGHSRQSKKEYSHFLYIAKGSISELQTQLLVAERIGYLKKEQIDSALNLSNEIGRMLSGLIRTLS